MGKGVLQNRILLLAGAVAGIIPGGEFLQLTDRVGKLPAQGVHPDEVEAAEKHIRPEPMQNIQHALVGTAAETIFFALFFQQQILLVKIGVILLDAVFPDGLAENAEGEGPPQIVAGAEGHALRQLQNIGHRDQPGIAHQGRIQADVLAAAEIFPKGVAAEIDRCVVIDLQKPL